MPSKFYMTVNIAVIDRLSQHSPKCFFKLVITYMLTSCNMWLCPPVLGSHTPAHCLGPLEEDMFAFTRVTR